MNPQIPRAAVVLALVAACADRAPAPAREEDPARARLQQHRNLGKAFYENPGAQNLAPDELRKALALNPDSAREHLNLGLALLRVGENDEAMAEIEKAREIDPTLPHTYFNLASNTRSVARTSGPSKSSSR